MSDRLPDLDAPITPAEDAGFGALDTPRGRLPLAEMNVSAQIDGLLAATQLRQRFVNAFAEPLEATYIFPLPNRAAVIRFRLEVAGRVVEGQLQERSRARDQYLAALREGHRVALAEEERPEVFTVQVGNLPPGESAVVDLTLCGPLDFSDGEATYRFPLVVAPRYIPGVPLPEPAAGDGTAADTDAVPDASRISPPVLLPGQPNPVRLGFVVDVRPVGLPMSDFRCSLPTEEVLGSEGTRRFVVRPGQRLDRDFLLRFRVADETVQTTLVFAPDASGEGGTFALTVVPPSRSTERSRGRDVVFLLDRSGSMNGWKMVVARRALVRMVETLTETDRFAVLAFDNTIETLDHVMSLLPAHSANRYRATDFLRQIESRGGTELAWPLEAAIGLLREPSRDRLLVLLTDGQVGNEDQILQNIGGRLNGLRIFTLGIDQAVNAGFLQRFAQLGGGSCELVESEARLEEVTAKIHRRLVAPTLSELKWEPEGWRFDPASLAPQRLPDLFPGQPLTIAGRYSGSPRGTVRVQAKDDAGLPWSVTVSATMSRNPAVTASWARCHLRDLEDQYLTRRHSEKTVLEKRIVETSLRFGVLCRFTGFVAVDVCEVVNAEGGLHRVTQPVMIPAGWITPKAERMEDYGCFASPILSRGTCMDLGTLPPPSAAQTPLPAPMASAPAGLQSRSSFGSQRNRQAEAEKAKQDKTFACEAETTQTGSRTEASIDEWAGYRQRAKELFERFESEWVKGDRFRALARLVKDLEELLDDLATVTAIDPLLESLKRLLEWLRGVTVSEPTLEQRIRDERIALTGEPSRPKRRWFWK